jgi:two-component system nitrogen regulation response regulator GlnG
VSGVERVALIGAISDPGLPEFLGREPRRLSRFERLQSGLDVIEREGADLVLVTLDAGADSVRAIRNFMSRLPRLPVVVMAPPERQAEALSLYQAGAFEYLPLPLSMPEAEAVITRALARREPFAFNERPAATAATELIGESQAAVELRRVLRQLSRANVPVLLQGEPGTGKRLFARLLFENGERAHKPYVAVNVAAVSRSFLDVELFGLERTQDNDHFHVRTGRVEEAGEGTIFLDEIAELPLDVQIRLSQVLAEGCFHRVGGQANIPSPVRLIAATTQRLENLVMNGQFQHELFHRLNVVRVQMPPLSERHEDIPLLAEHFLAAAAREQNSEPKQLTEEAARVLQQYAWPGNIRQLENLCRRLSVMVGEARIQLDHLPAELRPELAIQSEARSWEVGLQSWAERSLAAGARDILSTATPVMERILLQVALAHTGGRKQEAAELLGWGRNTLTRKLKELGLQEDGDL